MAGISRRALLGQAGLATAGLVLGRSAQAIAAPPGSKLGLALKSSVDESLLPAAAEIQRQVEEMVGFGPRLTGSPAHRSWIDFLEGELAAAGVAMSRDHFTFTRWSADSWGLEVLDGSGAGPVAVSSYFPYSGSTPPSGIAAPLVYAGPVPLPSVGGNPLDLLTDRWALKRWRDHLASNVQASLAAVPGGVAGKIVLLEAPVPPLSAADFIPLLTYSQEDGIKATASGTWNDYKRVWVVGSFIQYVLEAVNSMGPAGAVFVLDASAECAAGQYTPYAQPIFDVPALYVDRDTGQRLRALASGTPRVRLTLTADVEQKAPSDSLWGVMPGDGSTDEILIVNTHTDGQNAFEENGGIALVAIARYFAALSPSARRRTLVFSAFTGHFGPGLPQAQGFVDNHPDLIKRAAASLTIEHFGSTEWLDDARGYHPTGLAELGAVWHSQTAIAAPTVEAMRADDFARASALRPAGDYMIAVGGPLHKAGVPSLSYIAGPNYLVSVQPGDHLDKLDPVLFQRELVWSVDILQRFDRMPKQLLGAGDTAVWAHDGGALNSVP